MKKIFVIICLLFSVFIATVYADESKFWNVTCDNSFLRNRIEFYNNSYFDGKLDVTYINYIDGCLAEAKFVMNEYYWANPYKQIIVVDSQYFKDKSLEYLDAYLLDQLIFVYRNQFYPGEEVKAGRDGQIYKEQAQRLRSLGLKVISFSNSQQQTTQSSAPLNNNSKTNQKSIENTQTSKTTSSTTEQEEIKQVLSIFASYKYDETEYWSGDEEIFYTVYDNRGVEYHIAFEKAPRFEKDRHGSGIRLYNNQLFITVNGEKSTHYPVQEFINKVRSDSRIALGDGGVNSSQTAQIPKQNQNSQQTQSSTQQQTKPQVQQQQKTQPSTLQNNNSSSNQSNRLNDDDYINVSLGEFCTFRSNYINKKIKFSNVSILDIYENDITICGGSVWDTDFVGIKHNLSKAIVRDIKTKPNARWDVYVQYRATGLFRDIYIVQLEGLYIR